MLRRCCMLLMMSVGLVLAAGCQTETTIRRHEVPMRNRVTAAQLPHTPQTSPLAARRQPPGEAEGVSVMPQSSMRRTGAWGRFTNKVKRDWKQFTRSVEKAME